MKITEKLMQLGFEFKKYYGNMAYVFSTPRVLNMRFEHDFVYYPDENQFYINCHKTSHTETIKEKELIDNHNNLNAPAKDKWLEIRKELENYKFDVFGGI